MLLTVSAFILLLGALPEPQGSVVTQACDSSSHSLRRLSPITVQTGRLAPGESTCFGLQFQQGEFARIGFTTEIGYLKARLLGPEHHQLQVTWTSAFSTAAPSLAFAIEAPASGLYFIEVSVPRWVSFTTAQSFQIQLRDWQSTAARAAQRRELASDERVRWLRENAKKVRTINPADSTVEDLQFLHDVLRGVRVVLLGESDNGGGSDVLAKTRLVRFLHERMGFDVIAFQAGLFSAASANRALATESNPRSAMAKAGLGLLVRSGQADFLMQYLASRARSDRPLEVTGFDSQFTGTAASQLVADLRAFLLDRGIDSPLTDSASHSSRVLSGTIGGQFGTGRTLPSLTEQEQTLDVLRQTARNLESQALDREGKFWAQVLRSTAVQVGLALNNARGAGAGAFMRGFVRQMADNLTWLAKSAYPNRKIIVWSHSLHAIHNAGSVSRVTGTGYTVAQGLWEAIGKESFAIGLTSYDGRSQWVNGAEDYYQDLIPEQLAATEFETLMNAAGHQFAFVDLRTARARGDWLARPFAASPLHLVPEEADWSAALDALLFIRTQEPRSRIR